MHARGLHHAERAEILELVEEKVRSRVEGILWEAFEEKTNASFETIQRRQNPPKLGCDFWGYWGIFNVNPKLKVRVPLLKTGLEIYVIKRMISRSLSGTFLEIWFPYILVLMALICGLFTDPARALIKSVFGG